MEIKLLEFEHEHKGIKVTLQVIGFTLEDNHVSVYCNITEDTSNINEIRSIQNENLEKYLYRHNIPYSYQSFLDMYHKEQETTPKYSDYESLKEHIESSINKLKVIDQIEKDIEYSLKTAESAQVDW